MIKIRAPIWSDIFGHSGASGGRFRLDFGIIWGAVSGFRARDAKLANIAPRHSESTIFGVPSGTKKDQKWLRNQLPAATWLQERLGGLWGSILVHFGVHFEVPNRSKNDTENKLLFKCFCPPPGNLRAGLRRGNMTWFGPGGGLNWGGGNQSHRINVSTYQGFKDSWYQSINITRTLGDKRLRFYAFHRFYDKAPPQPGDPHKGGRRICFYLCLVIFLFWFQIM